MPIPIFVNGLIAPGGTPDTTLNQGGVLASGGTSATISAFPNNWPAAGLLRCAIKHGTDAHHEIIDIDLATRSTLTFTIARAVEEATDLPAIAHADGAGIWVLATASMFGGWAKLDSAQPSGVDTVDFLTIPATYKHLRILWQARHNVASLQPLKLYLNNDSGGNYDYMLTTNVSSTTTHAQSLAQTTIQVGQLASTAFADYPSSGEILIPNYAGTVFYKSVRAVNNHATAVASNGLVGGITDAWYRSTSAISRVTIIVPGGDAFVAGSEFTLYGLK